MHQGVVRLINSDSYLKDSISHTDKAFTPEAGDSCTTFYTWTSPHMNQEPNVI